MKNEYEIRGEVTAIFLKRKNGEIFETLISTSDLEKVKSFPYSWHLAWESRSRNFYVKASSTDRDGKRFTVKLHRFLFDNPKGKVIDHIDHNTLNNTRKNLRPVTQAQNLQNLKVQSNSKSKIRGVSYSKQHNKWKATIRVNGKNMHLGIFVELEDAEKVVIEARKKYMPYSTN